MPCESGYLRANRLEVEASHVFMLLDELNGKALDSENGNWSGYDERAYNKGDIKGILDRATATLCSRIAELDISGYSLEMQMWWRDHQRVDKEREQKEWESKQHEEAKRLALAKLTPAERQLLGLSP